MYMKDKPSERAIKLAEQPKPVQQILRLIAKGNFEEAEKKANEIGISTKKKGGIVKPKKKMMGGGKVKPKAKTKMMYGSKVKKRK